MKRVARVLVFLIALGAVLVIVGGAVWYFARGSGGSGGEGGRPVSLDGFLIALYLDWHAAELQQPAGRDDTLVTFVVRPGETAAQVAERLEAEGLVSDAQLFKLYLRYRGWDVGLEAGEFTLRQTMTIPQIAEVLQSGREAEQTVTIPEGLRLEEVAATVAAQTTISEEEFLALVQTGWREAGFDPSTGSGHRPSTGSGYPPYPFLADVPQWASLEGFLFPETYRLTQGATAADLLGRMLETFDQRLTPQMRAAAADRGLTLYDVVTLASIVEREAVVSEERPIIASVYFNRLEAGWLLNADPTVQYALGFDPETGSWWKHPLWLADLEVDSPYNTYRYPGLPPGPIASPGLASIQAVIYPADTDYFFFLADCTQNDGSHLFAVTEAEHLRNYEMCGGGEIP